MSADAGENLQLAALMAEALLRTNRTSASVHAVALHQAGSTGYFGPKAACRRRSRDFCKPLSYHLGQPFDRSLKQVRG